MFAETAFVWRSSNMTIPFRSPRAPDIDQVLAAAPWFVGLPAEIAAAVRSQGRLTALAVGTSLFEQGGAPTGLHAVISGELRIVALASNGNLSISGIARPGDWVGFLSCLDGRPHVYSGVAQQDMHAFSLTPAAVSSIFERDVASFRHLLVPELNVARQFYGYLMEDYSEPQRKIAARIAGLGRWPYAQAGGPLVVIDGLKQDDLAMSVKLSRQTVNATLRSFEAKGLIELGYGKIKILNPRMLEQIAKFGLLRD